MGDITDLRPYRGLQRPATLKRGPRLEAPMTNTWTDVVATALVAGVVVFYLGYVAFGSMPLVEDVRGMAAVGLWFAALYVRTGGYHSGHLHPSH